MEYINLNWYWIDPVAIQSLQMEWSYCFPDFEQETANMQPEDVTAEYIRSLEITCRDDHAQISMEDLD
jgi:hypothetical protein